MDLTTITGIVAGLLTTASLLPQLIKIIREKKVEDLSIGMFFCLLAGVILWVVYGIMRKDAPIIIFNAISAALNLCILFLRFKYKNDQ